MTDYTYNTGNPIGSTDVRDGVDNLKSFDVLLNSTDDTYQDRLGNTVPTAAGAIKRLGPVVTAWTFTTGGTLNYPNEAALNPADGNYYGWTGAFPKVVAPGTNPALPGSGYIPRTDVVLRNQVNIITPKAGSGSFTPYGGQLALLGEDLFDPLVQEMQLTFIGDSITWGVGSTGAESTGIHDKTLSDPRNNGTSPSYVNEFGRWVAGVLGASSVTTFSNHPASPSGESIRTITAVKNEFPIGGAYSVSGTGSYYDIIEQSLTGPALRARRKLGVANGGSASLSFSFTGSEFTLIYSQITSGASYQLTVDGVSLGTFSTAGAAMFNQRRTHSFPYIKNKIITFTISQTPGNMSTLELRFEGFAINKTVRIKNQGTSGVHSAQYVEYNMPTTLTNISPLLPSEIPSYSAAFSGTGANSFSIEDKPDAVRDKIYHYGFLSGGTWTITMNVPAGMDEVIVYYTSNSQSSGIEVTADSTVVETFYTSSLEVGGPTGYGKSKTVAIPLGSTTVTLKSVFKNYGFNTLYLNLEGIEFRNSAIIDYPTNNSFGDGVALDIKDSFAFVQLGINDRGSARISSPAATRNALGSLAALVPPNCKLIFMAPNSSIDYGGAYFNNAEVMQAIRQEAKRLNIDFINNRALFEGYNLSQYTTDNLHPSDFGHKLICENIITSIVRG